jgi:hypothetical protein
MERARRESLTVLATVTGMTDLYDGQLEAISAQPAIFYERVLGYLQRALYDTRTLVEAYDYYLARCAEAGVTPDQAHAAWQVHSSPDFEGELGAAEAYGPNAMRMIDEQILAKLGIAPHAAEVPDEDGDETDG